MRGWDLAAVALPTTLAVWFLLLLALCIIEKRKEHRKQEWWYYAWKREHEDNG